jgi:hypothetical protein
MEDIVFYLQIAKKITLESSKNDGLAHIKYKIVSPIILYY